MDFARCAVAALVACCVAVPGPVRAAAPAGSSVDAVAVAHPPPADPALSDPAWQAGLVGRQPYEDLATRSPAPVQTVTYLLYDSRNLYVAFHAEQPGTPIVADQTTNNLGFGLDDFVGIGVDPSGSGSQVYYFETTPRGVRYQQANENARFQPTWTAVARTNGDSWDAVLIVPLSIMHLHPGRQTWRINFIRQLAARGEHLTWAYDGLMQDGAVPSVWPNFTDVRFWPALRGVTLANGTVAARPQPRADLFALSSTGRDRNEFEQGNGVFAAEPARHIGLDASVPLTSTVSFVGTLAPDFSNIEVDQQTIAPQEFARQLTEYRPFFAQGAAFINPNPNPVGGQVSPPNLIFYSPGVGPFDRGFKIEGTEGNVAFGALSFRGFDETTGNTFDDIAYGVADARPDRTLTLWADGVLAHHSLAGSDATNEIGVKGRNLGTGLVWEADTSFEDGTAVGLPGFAHSTNGYVDVHKPNYEVNAGYTDVSPGYAPLDGFTAVSDIHGPDAYFNLLGNGTRIKSWVLGAYADRLLDDSGEVHEADSYAFLQATFKNLFSIDQLGPTVSELRSYAIPSGPHCSGPALTRTTYSGYPCYLGGRTTAYDTFAANFGYRDGTPSPLDAGLSFGSFGSMDLHQFTSSTSRPLGKHFSLALEYDGTFERPFDGRLPANSQILRRVSLGETFGADANLSLSLRAINGTGGFAAPGSDVALSFHRHYANGNELYVNFGTPAATATLDRLLVKYVLHVGGEPGT
jgi:hypothetical protein